MSALTKAPEAQAMGKAAAEDDDPAKKARLAAVNALIDLATADKDKYPPGYFSYWCCNPALFILAPFYTFPLSSRWASASLEHRGVCLNRPCLNEPGYDNDWAVPIYAAPLGMGANGKICEDPFLACLTMMPYSGWIVWCRNNERIELELINGRQIWPAVLSGDYTRSEHCEGHIAGWCIYSPHLLCLPYCVEACIGGCCDCCCCYAAHRRKKLRDRYKLKGTACGDYLLQCPMWLTAGGFALNVYQEAMELGKQQGYEVPFSTTAGGPGLLAVMMKKSDGTTTTAPEAIEATKK